MLTSDERGRILYECGDADDPPWETLTAAERQRWIVEAADPENDRIVGISLVQWADDVSQ